MQHAVIGRVVGRSWGGRVHGGSTRQSQLDAVGPWHDSDYDAVGHHPAMLSTLFSLMPTPGFALQLPECSFVATSPAVAQFFCHPEPLDGVAFDDIVAGDVLQGLDTWYDGPRRIELTNARDEICVFQCVCLDLVLLAVALERPKSPSAILADDRDPLTNLPTRRSLEIRMASFLRDARPDWGVLFLDLDNYKLVNDQLGHLAGDQALIAVAQKLCAHARPEDTLARFGGDEFVMLVDGVRSLRDLERVARRVSAMEVVVQGNSLPIRVTVSVGCAMATLASTVDELIGAADHDMYRAKRMSRQLPR